MADEFHSQHFIRGLRDGDPSAVRAFCDRYGDALRRIADLRLPANRRRRVGADDVVQSACCTFLRRVRAGEFHLPDSAALWQLMCAITLTKLREQARFHLRQKRGLAREEDVNAPPDASGPGSDAAGRDPGPAEAVEFADHLQQLISSLDPEEQAVVNLKLQDCTNEQVADQLGVSERTVRRVLKRVQARLAQADSTP
ncbi:MAG: sigma-70 family RNA polymerase sigma factor [Gemmataceae bacterium]|nr:sigma-70 family RNA polymerase sigma factor [Gemmataceae bacterium]